LNISRDWSREIKGATIPMGPGNLNYTLREPLGVVARIVAYKPSLMFAAVKIGAPLAAGNTVIVKAAEQAPLSALKDGRIDRRGFSAGCVNVLAGARRAARRFARIRSCAKVTLIGSVPTGRAVMRAAADTLKPVLLELGARTRSSPIPMPTSPRWPTVSCAG